MLKKLNLINPNQTATMLIQKIRLNDAGEVVDHISDMWLLPGQAVEVELSDMEGYVVCSRYITAEEALPEVDTTTLPDQIELSDAGQLIDTRDNSIASDAVEITDLPTDVASDKIYIDDNGDAVRGTPPVP